MEKGKIDSVQGRAREGLNHQLTTQPYHIMPDSLDIAYT